MHGARDSASRSSRRQGAPTRPGAEPQTPGISAKGLLAGLLAPVDVLSENSAMLQMAEELGFRADDRGADLKRVVLDLG